MVGGDGGVFERKDVERALELMARQHQRHCNAAVMPDFDKRQAGGQIAKGQPVDQGAGVDGAVSLVAEVDDERLEPGPEDPVEVFGQPIDGPLLRRGEVRHARIISAARNVARTAIADLR